MWNQRCYLWVLRHHILDNKHKIAAHSHTDLCHSTPNRIEPQLVKPVEPQLFILKRFNNTLLSHTHSLFKANVIPINRTIKHLMLVIDLWNMKCKYVSVYQDGRKPWRIRYELYLYLLVQYIHMYIYIYEWIWTVWLNWEWHRVPIKKY